MVRSGFKKPTYQKALDKKKAKSAKTPLKAKSSLKRGNTQLSKKKRATGQIKGNKGRSKLPTVKTMRNKCDALLTPIIKLMYPTCIFTGQPTQVAHHAIKKSTSTALRYYLPNLIPLTNQAHLRLHSDEILWTGRLIKIKGMEWWDDLEEKKNVYTKADVHFYIEQYARLKKIYDDLCTQ